MKYSEYLQLRDILEENGISEEEYKRDPELYEGILGSIGSGLINLAKKGMKAAVSKGISEAKKNELNNAAEKIKKWIIDEAIKGKEQEDHPLHKTIMKKEDLKDSEDRDAKAKIKVIDRELSNFLRKKVNNKVKSIEQKISKNKNLTEKDKDALLEYWDDLSINLQVAIAESLSDAGIIEDTSVESIISQLANTKPLRSKETPEVTSNKK